MATQEQLILAQTRAEAADIYKPELDNEKSGFIQDATAGIMGMQAFDESLYAVKGAVKDFERDYRTGEFKDGSLMDRFGRSFFGMKRGDFTGTLKNEDELEGDLDIEEIDDEFNLENDFLNGTFNVELGFDGTMTKSGFMGMDSTMTKSGFMGRDMGRGF